MKGSHRDHSGQSIDEYHVWSKQIISNKKYIWPILWLGSFRPFLILLTSQTSMLIVLHNSQSKAPPHSSNIWTPHCISWKGCVKIKSFQIPCTARYVNSVKWKGYVWVSFLKTDFRPLMEQHEFWNFPFECKIIDARILLNKFWNV